ncbi:MAG: hypothetical protein ACR2QM_13670 [Longimicrobiales bacterium]
MSDSFGTVHSPAPILGIRAKVELGQLLDGPSTVGIQVGHTTSKRQEGDEQDETLSSWDLAVVFDIYRYTSPVDGHSPPKYTWDVYIAPRWVLQKFVDATNGEEARGTLKAAVIGVAGSWRHLALIGELNFARTPTMAFQGTTFGGGSILLPAGGIRLMIPIGR